jgi:hypothetical protein
LGRQDAPTGKQSTAIVLSTASEKPVALVAAPIDTTAGPTAPSPPAAKPSTLDKPQQSDAKRKVEVALTAAAIAAMIVQASRDRYYATGHPCACPEDFTRNGQRCGGRSAYSRPGGAAPLCYPTDVTPAMIEAYWKTAAASR